MPAGTGAALTRATPTAAVAVRDLGIRFTQNRRRPLNVRDLLGRGAGTREADSFWPLRGVSFEIPAGESVGLVGSNGSGKSTLLRLVAGVLKPDEGSVQVNGRVAPLLQLSAGFSNDLTGRENVALVATLHGMSRREAAARMDEIMSFAGVRKFADTPLKHYSSGMRVRLAFAVIAQLPHPVLLVDEALAVGDKAFKKRCYAEIERMLSEGRTLMLVSHNEADLKRFCTRGLYLRDGALVVDGPLGEALEAYNSADD